jgi:hypothetical protein
VEGLKVVFGAVGVGCVARFVVVVVVVDVVVVTKSATQ